MKKTYLLIVAAFSFLMLNANAQIQHAINFDGTNDHINVGNWWNYQEFTVQMWINPAATQIQYAMIIDNNHIGFTRWNCQQNASVTNQYNFGVATTSGASAVIFNLNANVWQQLTLVKSDSMIKEYTNGVLIDSALCSGTIVGSGAGLDNIRIGSWNSGGRNWNGTMDEIRLWDYALTQAEIQANFNCELTGSEPGLLCYYKLNQGTAGGNNTSITTAFDGSSNAYHGTLIGFGLTGSSSNFVIGADSLSNCVTGVNEMGNLESSVLVFPNPATNQLAIGADGSGVLKEIEIYNVVGQKVFQSHLRPVQYSSGNAEREIVIDISELNSGIYFVLVVTDKKTTTQKLIVAK